MLLFPSSPLFLSTQYSDILIFLSPWSLSELQREILPSQLVPLNFCVFNCYPALYFLPIQMYLSVSSRKWLALKLCSHCTLTVSSFPNSSNPLLCLLPPIFSALSRKAHSVVLSNLLNSLFCRCRVY